MIMIKNIFKRKVLFVLMMVLIVILFSCETKVNNNDSVINDLIYQYKFVQKDIPIEDEELYKLHRSDGIYLTNKDNKLNINDFRSDNKITSFFVCNSNPGNYDVGTIKVVDYPEDGGYLYYISPRELYEINTRADSFYWLNGNQDIIYCVYSPSLWYPGAGSPGSITRIIKVDGKWQKDEEFEIDFNNEIRTFYVEDDIVYVITSTQLIKLKDDKIEQILVEDAFWGYWLCPNSIVKIDNLLYIGMRGGIASYNLDTGELLWYEQVVEED